MSKVNWFEILAAFTASNKVYVNKNIETSAEDAHIDKVTVSGTGIDATPIIKYIAEREYDKDIKEGSDQAKLKQLEQEIDHLNKQYAAKSTEINDSKLAFDIMIENLKGYSDTLTYSHTKGKPDHDNFTHPFFIGKRDPQSLKICRDALQKDPQSLKIITEIEKRALSDLLESDTPVKKRDKFVQCMKKIEETFDIKRKELKDEKNKLREEIEKKQNEKKELGTTYYQLSENFLMEVIRMSNTKAKVRLVTTKKAEELSTKDVTAIKQEAAKKNLSSEKAVNKPDNLTEVVALEIDNSKKEGESKIIPGTLESNGIQFGDMNPNPIQVLGSQYVALQKDNDNATLTAIELPVGSGKTFGMANTCNLAFVPSQSISGYIGESKSSKIISFTLEDDDQYNSHSKTIGYLSSGEEDKATSKNTLDNFIEFKNKATLTLEELVSSIASEANILDENKDKLQSEATAIKRMIEGAHFQDISQLRKKIDAFSQDLTSKYKDSSTGISNKEAIIKHYLSTLDAKQKNNAGNDAECEAELKKPWLESDDEALKVLESSILELMQELAKPTTKGLKTSQPKDSERLRTLIENYRSKFKIFPISSEAIDKAVDSLKGYTTAHSIGQFGIDAILSTLKVDILKYKSARVGYTEYQEPPSSPFLQQKLDLSNASKILDKSVLNLKGPVDPAELYTMAFHHNKTSELGYRAVIAYPDQENVDQKVHNHAFKAFIDKNTNNLQAINGVDIDEIQKFDPDALMEIKDNQIKTTCYSATISQKIRNILSDPNKIDHVPVFDRVDVNASLSLMMPHESIRRSSTELAKDQLLHTLFTIPESKNEGHIGKHTDLINENNLIAIAKAMTSSSMYQGYQEMINEFKTKNTYKEKADIIKVKLQGIKDDTIPDLLIDRYIIEIESVLLNTDITNDIYNNVHLKNTLRSNMATEMLKVCKRGNEERVAVSNILLNHKIDIAQDLPIIRSGFPNIDDTKDLYRAPNDLLDDNIFLSNIVRETSSLIDAEMSKKPKDPIQIEYIKDSIDAIAEFYNALNPVDPSYKINPENSAKAEKLMNVVYKEYIDQIKKCNTLDKLTKMSIKTILEKKLRSSNEYKEDPGLKALCWKYFLTIYSDDNNKANYQNIYKQIGRYKHPKYIERIMKHRYEELCKSIPNVDNNPDFKKLTSKILPMISSKIRDDISSEIKDLHLKGFGYTIPVFERQARRDFVDHLINNIIFKDFDDDSPNDVSKESKNQIIDEIRSLASTQCSPDRIFEKISDTIKNDKMKTILALDEAQRNAIKINITSSLLAEQTKIYVDKFKELIAKSKETDLPLSCVKKKDYIGVDPTAKDELSPLISKTTKNDSIDYNMVGFSLQSAGSGILIFDDPFFETINDDPNLLESQFVQSVGRVLRQSGGINPTTVTIIGPADNENQEKLKRFAQKYFISKTQSASSQEVENILKPREMSCNSVTGIVHNGTHI